MRALAVVLLLAPPLAAHPADSPRMDLLLALIEMNGGEKTEADAERILPDHGYDDRETRRIVGDLIFEGRIRVDTSGTLHIAPRDCPM